MTALCECGCGRPAPIATRHRPDRGLRKGDPSRFIRGHAMRGKTASLATRQKMSSAHKGFVHTAEARERMTSIAKRGPDHPDWKGDRVAYSTIHRWLSWVATKTGACSVCGDERITQWANLSGEYRRDVRDFAEMCVPCHKRYDRDRRQKEVAA